jgi:hypothetical protein
MGTSAESGDRGGRAAATQIPSAAPVEPLQYPRGAAVPAQSTAPQGYPPAYAAQGQYPPAPGAMTSPQGTRLSQAPPGRTTPLYIQPQQQQSSGGGFWSTLKEMFLSPSTAPNQRSLFDKKDNSPEY